MKSILKSLLTHPTDSKWNNYRTQFLDFYRGRDPNYDQIIVILDEFKNQFDRLMDWPSLFGELTASNETELLAWVQAIIEDPNVGVFAEDTHFVAYLGICENNTTFDDSQKVLRSAQAALATAKKDTSSIVDQLELVQVAISRIKSKANRQEASVSTFMDGEQGDNLRKIYETNVAQRESGNTAFFNIPIQGLDHIYLKPGDLGVFAAFTSQGKSIWLRWMVYQLAVKYGLNSIFLSLEMGHDAVRSMFSLLHANNKSIFPNTPIIEMSDFKQGKLTDEQYDFLFNKAEKDLLNNPSYGIIHIDQPNKAKYKLDDLQQKVKEIETEKMEVHAVAVDYITLMHPLDTDRGRVQNEDYNQLIKSFKNMGLAHRNPKGQIAPFIALTAAQVSRGKYEEAVKNEGQYDITAMSMYTEFERSGDVILTSYAPPDFRNLGKIRVQNHKFREGAVDDKPIDLFCGYSQGYTISEIAQRSEEETVALLQSMQF